MDVVAFWVLAVRAIGLSRLSGATFAKSAAWLFGLWLLWTGLWIVAELPAEALRRLTCMFLNL